ncbi:C40 family peptidase [Cryobacterium sp. AP23]
MTMVDALSRVGEIQSRLVELNDLVAGRVSADTSTAATTTSATTSATSPASAASATSFAEALTAATSATGATAAGTVTNGASGTGTTGTDIVANAEKYLGVPYVFGGEDSSGMDCSGLVQRVYADAGIEVPRLVSGQMTIGTEVASLAEAKPGDLIVTGGGDHILIYAGDNQVIHAPYEGRTVSKVEAYMDESDITTIRRVIPDQIAAASTGTSAIASTTASATGTAPTDLVAAAYASLFSGSTAGSSTDLTSTLSASGLLS